MIMCREARTGKNFLLFQPIGVKTSPTKRSRRVQGNYRSIAKFVIRFTKNHVILDGKRTVAVKGHGHLMFLPTSLCHMLGALVLQSSKRNLDTIKFVFCSQNAIESNWL